MGRCKDKANKRFKHAWVFTAAATGRLWMKEAEALARKDDARWELMEVQAQLDEILARFQSAEAKMQEEGQKRVTGGPVKVQYVAACWAWRRAEKAKKEAERKVEVTKKSEAREILQVKQLTAKLSEQAWRQAVKAKQKNDRKDVKEWTSSLSYERRRAAKLVREAAWEAQGIVQTTAWMLEKAAQIMAQEMDAGTETQTGKATSSAQNRQAGRRHCPY
ncbi:hypothetical protein FRC07_009726 [Ceratobasidium sp. 392]|nr:hypothetical protein FRC07_009726 [Ceratobasidium sp. 392]